MGVMKRCERTGKWVAMRGELRVQDEEISWI